MEIHQGRAPASAADSRLRRHPTGYVISHNRDRIDSTRMVGWLLGAYWTHWQKPDQIQTAIKNSIVIGAFAVGTSTHHPLQVGFARIISDRATNSLLTDLYVDEPHRRRGVGRMLMEAVTQHDAVRPTACVLGCRQHLRMFYTEFGFVPLGGDIMIRNPTP